MSTLLDDWRRHVAERPEACAVAFLDTRLSYAELDASSDALACALAERGVGHGDRLALHLQNDPQFVLGTLAAWKLGAVPVAVSPMLVATELAHHLRDSGATVLLTLDSLHSVAAEVVPGTAVTTVVTTHPLDLTPAARPPAALAAMLGERGATVPAGAVGLPALLAEGAGHRPPPVDLIASDVAMITYTSGTTGPAKGALNTHGGVAYNSRTYRSWWDLRPGEDVVLCIAPVFHITGIVAGIGAAVTAGVPLVLLHRFDAEAILAAISDYRATFMVAASTAYLALITHPSLSGHDVSSLTKTVSGGAPVSTTLVERVRTATGWQLHGAYGMTETNSPTHLGPPGVEHPVDPETGALAVGVPVPGCRVRIVDPQTGGDLGPGEIGEIAVAGPMVFPGYWNRPDESAHAVRDGWLHTGDLGKQDEQGWLWVVDRLKDVIIAGGYKVYPRDVEDVLVGHPDVREAAVVGVPDEYRGETVLAVVVPRDGATVTADELIDYCRARMSSYKYPRQVHLVAELPKNAAGKVLRRALRQADSGGAASAPAGVSR